MLVPLLWQFPFTWAQRLYGISSEIQVELTVSAILALCIPAELALHRCHQVDSLCLLEGQPKLHLLVLKEQLRWQKRTVPECMEKKVEAGFNSMS